METELVVIKYDAGIAEWIAIEGGERSCAQEEEAALREKQTEAGEVERNERAETVVQSWMLERGGVGVS